MYQLYTDKWISFPQLYSYRFPASTMDSSLKDTHRYAFELAKAAREMAVDIAEKLPHLAKIRSNYQAEALKIRINKKFN